MASRSQLRLLVKVALVEKLREKESDEKKTELFDFDKVPDAKHGKEGTSECDEFYKRTISYSGCIEVVKVDLVGKEA